ncbi:MAG: Xaa-Pro peptidase family protein [Deinococcales bacterium]
MTSPTQTRLASLKTLMKAEAIDLIALGPTAHMQWLLGFHPHADERPCLLLLTQESEAFLMPALNAEGSKAHSQIPFYTWSDEFGPESALKAALTDLKMLAAQCLILDETMRADFALLLLDHLPQAKHAFTQRNLGRLRMSKDETEYKALKMNAAIADRVMQQAFKALKVGMSELELAAIVQDSFKSQGAKPMFAIIGRGPNGAYPHHQTGQDTLQEGDVVVIDIGGSKEAYPSDITRVAVVGKAPEEYQHVHDTVNRAVEAALAVIKPGVRAKDIDSAARQVISQAGYGPYFVHRTGHGLGLEIHEPPYITSTSDLIIEAGMVFSVEPGIYLPGRFGVRLEEIVIVRQTGPEILSDLSREAHWV